MSGSTPKGFEGLSEAALEILRQRAESLANETQSDEQVDLVGLLLFRLADEWYAVHIGNVREIYKDYNVTPIPGVPEYILGILNIRGEIVSVTDLAALMRIPGRGEHDVAAEQPSAIVASSEACLSALLVDEIGDIVEVAEDSIEPPLATIERGQSDWVSGSVYMDGRLVGIVDLDRILAPIGENE